MNWNLDALDTNGRLEKTLFTLLSRLDIKFNPIAKKPNSDLITFFIASLGITKWSKDCVDLLIHKLYQINYYF